jgi:phosphoribosylglycinamide formyltransferase-1
LNAQKQALEYGAKVTGCTVHYVDAGCDTGPVILQSPIEIEDADTVETLSKRLLIKEHHAIVEAVRLIEEDKVILQGRKTLLRNMT